MESSFAWFVYMCFTSQFEVLPQISKFRMIINAQIRRLFLMIRPLKHFHFNDFQILGRSRNLNFPSFNDNWNGYYNLFRLTYLRVITSHNEKAGEINKNGLQKPLENEREATFLSLLYRSDRKRKRCSVVTSSLWFESVLFCLH